MKGLIDHDYHHCHLSFTLTPPEKKQHGTPKTEGLEDDVPF